MVPSKLQLIFQKYFQNYLKEPLYNDMTMMLNEMNNNNNTNIRDVNVTTLNNIIILIHNKIELKEYDYNMKTYHQCITGGELFNLIKNTYIQVVNSSLSHGRARTQSRSKPSISRTNIS